MTHDLNSPPDMPPLPPPPPPATRQPAVFVSTPKPDLFVPAFVVWMLVFAAILLFRTVHTYAADKGLPFALGSASAPFLMGAAIAGFLRLFNVRRFRFTMTVAVAVIMAVNILGSVSQQANSAARREDMHDAVAQMRDIANGKTTQPLASTGPLGQLMPKLQALVTAERQQQMQHQAAQQALTIETVLAPESLLDKAHIADGRDRLTRSLAEDRASIKDYAAFQQSVRALFEDLPPAERAGALAGFDEKMPPLEAAMDRYLHVEEDFHIAANTVLNIAEANIGRIGLNKATGNLVMPHDVAVPYNEQIHKIQAIAKEEASAMADLRNLQAAGQADMNDMERQLR